KRSVIQYALQFSFSIKHAIISQWECTKMHGKAVLRLHFLMNKHGFIGRHMNGLHKPAGSIRANRYKRSGHGTELLANLFKKVAVPSITCKIQISKSCLQHIAAPKGLIAVKQAPSGEMAGRDGRNREILIKITGFPPVQRYRAGNMMFMQ